MNDNPRLNAAVLEVVENQLRDLDPPETKQTYDRLLAAGYDDPQAREMIGKVVLTEIVAVLQSGRPYDEQRFTAALAKLPDADE
jgi:hypothetical protein